MNSIFNTVSSEVSRARPVDFNVKASLLYLESEIKLKCNKR